MAIVQGIDHVALAVRDVARSVAWYRKVLELDRLHEDVWGDYPAMVGVGNTSVALFPLQEADPAPHPGKNTVAMRHLAFRTDLSGFLESKERLKKLNVEFYFQNHEIAHSIYFLDPDGYEIEITTYELEDR